MDETHIANKAETPTPQKNGISLIAAERQRQLSVEGWTPEHDDAHSSGEMAQAAAIYAIQHAYRHRVFFWLWPWDLKWFKPADRKRELVKSGALIAAELDRLLRKESAGRAPSVGRGDEKV